MFMKTPSIRYHCGSRAFTLLELVVVIAATAVLLGQVAPAMRNVRQSGKQLSCQDKLGQIARAGLVYAARDPNEFAIPIGQRDGDPRVRQTYSTYYGYGGKSGAGPAGANASIFSGFRDMGAVHRPLNTILFKTPFEEPTEVGGIGTLNWTPDNRLNLDVYHCPGDQGFSGMHHNGWRESGVSSYNYYGTSYAANALFVGSPGVGSALHSNSPYGRPVSSVPNPANTVLFWENAARFAYFATNLEDYPDQDSEECFWPFYIGDFTANGWHGTPFHFYTSFVDGHVAWLKIKGYGPVASPPNMPPTCSLFDPGVCECFLIRGQGYQLDTLPADLVPTRKIRFSGQSSSGGGDDNNLTIFTVVDQ